MGAAQSKTSASGTTVAPKVSARYNNHHVEDRVGQRKLEKEYCLVEDEKCESGTPIQKEPG